MNPLLSTEDFSNLDNLKKCFKKLDYGICSPDLAFWRLMHFARIYQIFPLVKYLINENQRKAKLMSNSSCVTQSKPNDCLNASKVLFY